jgi:hypothetical protein
VDRHLLTTILVKLVLLRLPRPVLEILVSCRLVLGPPFLGLLDKFSFSRGMQRAGLLAMSL